MYCEQGFRDEDKEAFGCRRYCGVGETFQSCTYSCYSGGSGRITEYDSPVPGIEKGCELDCYSGDGSGNSYCVMNMTCTHS